MALHRYFQPRNGLPVPKGLISRAFTQLSSTYWSFHIGWENVTGRSCMWVWVSGGWAARQHLYYTGACMLKYFCKYFSSRNYFTKIFSREIYLMRKFHNIRYFKKDHFLSTEFHRMILQWARLKRRHKQHHKMLTTFCALMTSSSACLLLISR